MEDDKEQQSHEFEDESLDLGSDGDEYQFEDISESPEEDEFEFSEENFDFAADIEGDEEDLDLDYGSDDGDNIIAKIINQFKDKKPNELLWTFSLGLVGVAAVIFTIVKIASLFSSEPTTVIATKSTQTTTVHATTNRPAQKPTSTTMATVSPAESEAPESVLPPPPPPSPMPSSSESTAASNVATTTESATPPAISSNDLSALQGELSDQQTEMVKQSKKLQAQLGQLVQQQVSQATASTENRLNSLEQQNVQNMQQIQQLAQGVQQVENQVRDLNNAINNLLAAVKKQTEADQQRAQMLQPPSLTGPQQQVRSPDAPDTPERYKPQATAYHVQAIIPGRAWLRDSEGRVISVARGDALPGYGQVTKIDPRDGNVMTSSGAVIKYGIQQF